MKDIFERIFKLIKKTGDKVIIINPDSDFSYVLMTLDDYEEAVMGQHQMNLTVEKTKDKMDKINQEIALWREKEKEKEESGLVSAGLDDEKSREEEEGQFYLEPVE